MSRSIPRPAWLPDNPYITDGTELIEQILDATERDSVIEGLPPFDEAFRNSLREQLAKILTEEA